MSEPRHTANRRTWRWRPAGFWRLGGVLLVVALIAFGFNFALSSKGNSDSTTTSTTTSTTPDSTTTTVPTPLNKIVPPGPKASSRRLSLYKVITGDISPKSVMSTNTGLVFAQNMMYRHTMTVYNSRGTLLKTISDGVELAHFGVRGRPGLTHGAPVEAAVTPDGKDVWVSNYSMYGTGSGPEGSDTCTPGSAVAAGDTPSFLYEVSTKSLAVVGVAPVGMVPKYVAVTPNDKYVIASNWCSWTVSIVNEATHHLVATIPVGAYPRGIAISPDSHLAYVAIMGSDVIDVVSLSTFRVVGQIGGVDNVRHVVIDPQDPDFLYASLNVPGDVVKIDRLTGKILAEVHTGSDCRSLAISTDGTALYVVNYLSNTVTELAASNLKVLQVVATGTNPVGVTYDGTTGRVWVAVYTGEILVFNTKS